MLSVLGTCWGAGHQEHLLCILVKPGQTMEVDTVVSGQRTESPGQGQTLAWREPELALGSEFDQGQVPQFAHL